jgi:hypothetical protein
MKDVHDDLLPAGFFDDGGVAQSMDTGASVDPDGFDSGFNDGRIW